MALKALLEARREATSELERARLEFQIRKHVGAVRKVARLLFENAIEGYGLNAVESRAALLPDGDETKHAALWRQIEEGTLALRQAVKVREDFVPRQKRVLEGNVEQPTEKAARPKVRRAVKKDPLKKHGMGVRRGEPWKTIYALVEQEARRLLDGVDQILIDQLAAEARTEMKIVIDSLCNRLRMRVRHAEQPMNAELRSALEILGLDPPRRLADVADMIDAARKRKRELALQYHPDRHGPELAEPMAARYRAVIEAFEVVQRYADRTKKEG